MGRTHPLLKRQIKKCLGDQQPATKEWQSFLKIINETYKEFDDDRAILERALDISSREYVQATAQLLKLREIALGIESRVTVRDVVSFIVESAREIPGIGFVLVQTLDESGQYIITPYYSEVKDNNTVKLLQQVGFDIHDYLGKHSTSGKLKYEVAKLKVAQGYIRNPRVIVKDKLTDLLDGVWPKVLCDAIQKILGVKQFVITPLLIEGKSWGNLLFFLNSHVPQDTLKTITAHCALGIKNALMLESLQIQNLELAKAKEQALDNGQYLRTLFDSLTAGLILIDPETRTIVDVNQYALSLCGTSKDKIVGNICHKCICTAEINRCPVIDLGQTIDLAERVLLDADGQKIPILNSVKPVTLRGHKYLLESFIDLTERKKADIAIKKQKELIDRILAIDPNAVLVVDKDLHIMLANNAVYQMCNYQDGELEGKAFEDVIAVDKLIGHILETLSGKSKSTQTEVKCTLNGHERIIAANILQIAKQEVLCILSDLTEERRKQEGLYLTDRLASVGAMAAGVAHEINNPLTSIVGLTELLLEGQLPSELEDDLHTISSEAQRAAGIVKNLLSFSRKHDQVTQSTQMNDIIEDVLKLRAYEHMVNNITVERKLDTELPEVMVDRFQFQQVFLNLILNAEQAMIEAHGEGMLSITSEQVDGMVRLYFSDDGPGISKMNLVRVFDPFFTTKEVGKGTGLGLSISYGIVTNHGGKIYADSELGRGATFLVELPIKIKSLLEVNS